MSFNSKKSFSPLILFVGLIIILNSSTVFSQIYDLELAVGNVTAVKAETNVEIPIFLKNYVDTIAGFQIWIQNDRPDLMEYNLTFDTTGCLTSGWHVATNSLSGINQDILITATRDIVESNFIYPQSSDTPLLKIYVDVYDIPESLYNETVNLIIQYEFVDHFSFSDQYGNLVGMTYQYYEDTTWYQCTAWAGEVCLNYEIISGPPADSFFVYFDSSLVVDLSTVLLTNGSLTVLGQEPFICGDVNADGTYNISDITYLVAYLFSGGPGPIPLESADCNGDGIIGISDLTCFICYMFSGCPPPTCGL